MHETPPPTTTDLLTRTLYGDNFRQEHGFWRRLITTEPFRRPGGGTPDERLALSYHRLRILNGALDSGARLAADPRALAALHEWLGPVDPALTTVAGIHYNLFLGSLLDHDPSTLRDLSDFLELRNIGTFLCTEVAHGNDAAAVETTATYDRERDGFVLHTPHAGAQKFMPNTSPAGAPRPEWSPPGSSPTAPTTGSSSSSPRSPTPWPRCPAYGCGGCPPGWAPRSTTASPPSTGTSSRARRCSPGSRDGLPRTAGSPANWPTAEGGSSSPSDASPPASSP